MDLFEEGKYNRFFWEVWGQEQKGGISEGGSGTRERQLELGVFGGCVEAQCCVNFLELMMITPVRTPSNGVYGITIGISILQP